MAKQEIRQALNKLDISGVIKEHKLKAGKGDNGNYINGSFVIKAGEFTEITVKVCVEELTGKGKVKKSYESLNKILKGTVKTMAEAPEEEAVKVRLWGNDGFTPQFKEEIYKPENATDVVTRVGVELGFGNLTIDEKIKPENYEAKFDVEMFVESVEEELDKNEEETGRVIVKGWCPVYGGSVIPLEIKVGVVVDDDGEFDFAEDIRNSVDPETTVNFWGDIDFKAIVEKTSKGGAIGKAKVDKKTTYIHDLVAIGADFIEGENEYEIEDIQQARVERENKKQEVKDKSNGDEKQGKGNTNNKFNRSNRGNRPATNTKNSKNVSNKPSTDDDIPF